MSKPFVIDSCALMDARQNYSMTSQFFSRVWKTFEEMITKGELISSSEVMDELKDDQLITWAKQHRECFLPLSQDIQDETRTILKQYPLLIQMRSIKNSNADPFLIATAVINHGTVVTNERLGDERNGQIKIPNVCRAKGIPYITLSEFMDQIMP